VATAHQLSLPGPALRQRNSPALRPWPGARARKPARASGSPWPARYQLDVSPREGPRSRPVSRSPLETTHLSAAFRSRRPVTRIGTRSSSQADFHRWYPGFIHTTTDRHDLAA